MRGVYCAVTPLMVVLVATLASPQAHSDFSGRWMLDSSSPAPPDAARVLVIEQPVTRTNVRGEPAPPNYLHLSVRREGPSVVTEVHDRAEQTTVVRYRRE